jgi:hypothetical protein
MRGLAFYFQVESTCMTASFQTSLTPPLFIEVLVPSQEMCFCITGVSILPLSTIFSAIQHF